MDVFYLKKRLLSKAIYHDFDSAIIQVFNRPERRQLTGGRKNYLCQSLSIKSFICGAKKCLISGFYMAIFGSGRLIVNKQ
jgi:hypothetical protein